MQVEESIGCTQEVLGAVAAQIGTAFFTDEVPAHQNYKDLLMPESLSHYANRESKWKTYATCQNPMTREFKELERSESDKGSA